MNERPHRSYEFVSNFKKICASRTRIINRDWRPLNPSFGGEPSKTVCAVEREAGPHNCGNISGNIVVCFLLGGGSCPKDIQS